jgi:hypothetical protein
VRAAARRFFEVVACNVRRANEKGRVESGVGYVKKIFCVDCGSRCRSAISNMVGMRESMPVIEPEILWMAMISDGPGRRRWVGHVVVVHQLPPLHPVRSGCRAAYVRLSLTSASSAPNTEVTQTSVQIALQIIDGRAYRVRGVGQKSTQMNGCVGPPRRIHKRRPRSAQRMSRRRVGLMPLASRGL